MARVYHSCNYCRKTRGVLTAQQIGDLAVEQIPPGCKPFKNDAFVPLTEDQLLQGRNTRGLLQPQVGQDTQSLGTSRHQQDLVSLWWNQWKEQGFDEKLVYNYQKETQRHANLKEELCTVNQDLNRRLGEEDQDIEIGVQQMDLLGSTDKVEPLGTPYNYDFKLPGACCPELPSDIAK